MSAFQGLDIPAPMGPIWMCVPSSRFSPRARSPDCSTAHPLTRDAHTQHRRRLPPQVCVVIAVLLVLVRSLSLSPDLSADSLRPVALAHPQSTPSTTTAATCVLRARAPSIVAGPRARAALADPLPRTAPPPDCRPSASPSRPKRSAPRPSFHSLHCAALRHSALGTRAHARLDARPNATQCHSSLLSPFLYPPRLTGPETHHNAPPPPPPPRPPPSLLPSSSLERLSFSVRASRSLSHSQFDLNAVACLPCLPVRGACVVRSKLESERLECQALAGGRRPALEASDAKRTNPHSLLSSLPRLVVHVSSAFSRAVSRPDVVETKRHCKRFSLRSPRPVSFHKQASDPRRAHDPLPPRARPRRGKDRLAPALSSTRAGWPRPRAGAPGA